MDQKTWKTQITQMSRMTQLSRMSRMTIMTQMSWNDPNDLNDLNDWMTESFADDWPYGIFTLYVYEHDNTIHINIFKFKSLLHINNIGSGLISFVAVQSCVICLYCRGRCWTRRTCSGCQRRRPQPSSSSAISSPRTQVRTLQTASYRCAIRGKLSCAKT